MTRAQTKQVRAQSLMEKKKGKQPILNLVYDESGSENESRSGDEI